MKPPQPSVTLMLLLLLPACSGDGTTPADDASKTGIHCDQLSKTPDGLLAAVQDAVVDAASADDKAVIDSAVAQLRGASSQAGAPAALSARLDAAAASLDKLSMGQPLSETDVKSISLLGEALEAACPRS